MVFLGDKDRQAHWQLLLPIAQRSRLYWGHSRPELGPLLVWQGVAKEEFQSLFVPIDLGWLELIFPTLLLGLSVNRDAWIAPGKR